MALNFCPYSPQEIRHERLLETYDEIGFGAALSSDSGWLVVNQLGDFGTADSDSISFYQRDTSGVWQFIESFDLPIYDNDFPVNAELVYPHAIACKAQQIDTTPYTEYDSCHFYHHNGVSWSEIFSYQSSDNNISINVRIQGDYAYIGEPGYFNTMNDDGQVAIYQFDSGTPTWTRVGVIPSPTSNNKFGFSLAITGNNLFVGEPEGDVATSGSDEGRVHHYVGSGTSWTHTNVITPTTGTGEYALQFPANFGFSIAARDNHLLIGAPGSGSYFDPPISTTLDGVGGIALYTISPFQELYTRRGQGQQDANFGRNVAVGNGLIAVSAPFHNGYNTASTATLADSGYVVVLETTVGSTVDVLTEPIPRAVGWFGFGLDFSDTNELFVGAAGSTVTTATPNRDLNGAVYAYECLNIVTTPAPTGNTTSSDPNLGLILGLSIPLGLLFLAAFVGACVCCCIAYGDDDEWVWSERRQRWVRQSRRSKDY